MASPPFPIVGGNFVDRSTRLSENIAEIASEIDTLGPRAVTEMYCGAKTANAAYTAPRHTYHGEAAIPEKEIKMSTRPRGWKYGIVQSTDDGEIVCAHMPDDVTALREMSKRRDAGHQVELVKYVPVRYESQAHFDDK